MALFFDCCQLMNREGIKVADIQKEYMAIYSAPPNEVSFHHYGVGLMVTCLVEMLQYPFRGSLNDLQSELRQKLMSKMVDALGIPSDELDEFKRKHLPHHTSAMFDINLYKKISEAMQPVTSVEQSADSIHKVCVSVYSPLRILYHPTRSNFELRKYQYVVETEDGRTIDLDLKDAEFSEFPEYHVIHLPPQVCKMTGKLRVGAVYGDERAEFSRATEVALPYYGKPSISSCTLVDNGCAVRVDYNPNVYVGEGEAYHVEHIDTGFSDSTWKTLHREDGFNHSESYSCTITLPPSLTPVKRNIQVAVKYRSCPTIIYSDPCIVDQLALSPPKIDSIVHEDNLTGNLKFSPNQPSQNAQYRVESYRLESQLNDTCHWVDSLTRSLSPEETLNRQETVTFPLRLVEDEKTCAYRVALRYHNVEEEVISQVHPERLRRTDVPTVTVTTKSPLASTATLSLSHPDSYRSDSTLCNKLKYEIVQRNSSEGVETSQSIEDSIEVPRSLASSFKLRVYFADRKDLGCINSETYNSEGLRNCCCSFWNVVPDSMKLFLFLLILFATVTTLSFYYGTHLPHPLSNQLIAVEQTIPFPLTDFTKTSWCSGASAEEYTVDYSDFIPGFDISAYLVESLSLKTVHFTIPSTKYPYINESIDLSDDEQRYLLPLNYYHDPPHLLGGSVVSLRCKIDMPKDVDDLDYAVVNIFNSRGEAVKYQQWEVSDKNQVHLIDVTDCAKSVCIKNHTFDEASFYFFVFSTKADSVFQVTAEFTFEVFRYVNPTSLPSALNVANISKNSSGFIPNDPSKTLLLYAHPPNESAYERLAHLNFTCMPNLPVRVPVLTFLIVLEVGVLVLYSSCWCWCKKRRRRLQQSIDTEMPPTVCETTPLINS